MKPKSYGVETTDPATFAVVSLLLFLVALLVCHIPGRQATTSDPIMTLR